ncbi:MAG: hypothetical protein ACFFCS_04830 [Candidatus Hodarchaeota archaeon]
MAKKGIFYRMGNAIANASGKRGFDASSRLREAPPKEEILEEGKELSQCFYCGDATTTECSVCGKAACVKHRRELPDFTQRTRGNVPFCVDCASTVKPPPGSRADRPRLNIDKKAVQQIICCVITVIISIITFFFW